MPNFTEKRRRSAFHLALYHDIAWKAVIGGSYRFPIESGMLAYAEYHYSGFGAVHPEVIAAMLTTGFIKAIAVAPVLLTLAQEG